MIYKGKTSTRGTDHQPLQRFTWEQQLHTWLQHGEDPKVYIPDLIVPNSPDLQLVGSMLPHEHEGIAERNHAHQDFCAKPVGSSHGRHLERSSSGSSDAASAADILGSPPTHSHNAFIKHLQFSELSIK